jgi:hypothetical protein
VDPLVHAEKQVEYVLDDLQTRGVLHWDSRLDIESLLNPKNKAHITVVQHKVQHAGYRGLTFDRRC